MKSILSVITTSILFAAMTFAAPAPKKADCCGDKACGKEMACCKKDKAEKKCCPDGECCKDSKAACCNKKKSS